MIDQGIISNGSSSGGSGGTTVRTNSITPAAAPVSFNNMGGAYRPPGGLGLRTLQGPHALAAAKAVALSLSDIELKLAAAELKHLLGSVPQCLLQKGPLLTETLQRYEFQWLPLLSAHSGAGVLAPPPDVAWVWAVHMLSPQQYKDDCMQLFGKVLHREPSALLRKQVTPAVGVARAKLGLPYTDEEYRASEAAWQQKHGSTSPYFLPFVTAPAFATRAAKASAAAAAVNSKATLGTVAVTVTKTNGGGFGIGLQDYQGGSRVHILAPGAAGVSVRYFTARFVLQLFFPFFFFFPINSSCRRYGRMNE